MNKQKKKKTEREDINSGRNEIMHQTLVICSEGKNGK